jgi:hypothetical protein
MPRDVELGVGMGLLVCFDCFFETTFADVAPGANLLLAVRGRKSTVSETMSILI